MVIEFADKLACITGRKAFYKASYFWPDMATREVGGDRLKGINIARGSLNYIYK